MTGFGDVSTLANLSYTTIDPATLTTVGSSVPEIIDPTTGEPYLTLQDVQNAINNGFQSVTAAVPSSLTAWLQQNSMVVYAGAAALFVLALFGGGRRR